MFFHRYRWSAASSGVVWSFRGSFRVPANALDSAPPPPPLSPATINLTALGKESEEFNCGDFSPATSTRGKSAASEEE